MITSGGGAVVHRSRASPFGGVSLRHRGGMSQLESRLEALLRRQSGLTTRAQLLAAGVTDDQIAGHVRGRRWQRLATGLYACFTGELGESQRLIAACLHIGAGAQITGAAALRWHGVRAAPEERAVAVLAPHPCHRRDVPGVLRVVQTRRPDRRPHHRGVVTVASVARAVADQAHRLRWLGDVRALVAESVQRGLATVPQLVAEVEEGQRNGSALLRRAVDEVGAGVRSAPEAELRALLSRSAILPLILWNPRLRLPDGTMLSPDGWIAESAIALEVDSREYHLGPDGWERTMRRHNLLAAADVLTLHLTPARLRTDPLGVIDLVVQAHLARRGRGNACPIAVIMMRSSA